MKVLYVADKFRTNPLSLTPGGFTINVEYYSGNTFVYDKIKFPPAYIARVSPNDIIHGNIKRIYIDGEEVNLKQFINQVKKYINKWAKEKI